jgi:phosphoglycolate phosphatase-like HAD superfamily hydrolase
LHFNPASAFMIGDKESDIEFGRRAGATTILIASEPPAVQFRTPPDLIAPNLIEAARMVTSRRD